MIRNLLILFALLSLVACNPPGEAPVEISIHDAIFDPVKECLSRTTVAKAVLEVSVPIIDDDTIEHGPQDPYVILRMSDERNRILSFIDSFPVITGRANTVETVSAFSSFSLYLICNSDTLLKGSWDPGRKQVWLNGTFYNTDFAKLDKALKLLKKHTYFPAVKAADKPGMNRVEVELDPGDQIELLIGEMDTNRFSVDPFKKLKQIPAAETGVYFVHDSLFNGEILAGVVRLKKHWGGFNYYAFRRERQ